MLLQTLAEFPTVEDAAKEMAGNWQKWECFVWFGSDDVGHSDQVLLGYLVNHESTLRQLTNMEYVRKELDPYWGDMTKGALVGDYGADFWGERKMLSGLMCRVYQDGEITEAFRRLYGVAMELKASYDAIVDEETFRAVRHREMLRYVYSTLEYECRKRSVAFSGDLAQQITDELISDEVDFDNDDVEREIKVAMGWEVGDDDGMAE